MEDTTFLSQFSPQWTKPDALEKILVQREDLLAASVEKIRDSILTPNKHHLLFIGPRGSGKTDLITLIHHRLQDPKLLKQLRFGWLNEDEIATSFLKLLVLIYRSLSERYPEAFPAATINEVTGLDPLAAEEKLGQALLRDLGNRTLVVLMENLDSLLRHLPEEELLRWRAFVQNHPVFATVGTAQALFSGVSDRNEPFFGFFDAQHLEPLSVSDALLLLEKIATLQGKTELLDFLKTPTGKARVSAIHDLAGGNPRLYLIFSEFLSREALDDLVRPFEEMVDRQLTSYYQERLRWLSPQQREIVQLLCHHGRPIPVKQIAEGLFTTHNSITGQLKPLRDMRYVNHRQIGREVLYELAEPLMRLALQVKETHNRKPLALIVDFLRVWHDRQEIEQRLAELDPSSQGRRYYAETLAIMDSGAPNLRHEILRQGLENLPPEQCDDDTLSNARILAEESSEAADWVRVGTILNTREEWDEAIDAFSNVIGMKDTPVVELAKAFHERGYAYHRRDQINQEIADYTSVIDLPGAPPESVALALNGRAWRHFEAGEQEEAIADCTRAIDLNGTPPKQLAKALNNRGVTLRAAGRQKEAIADYTRAIEMPGMPKQLAKALNNRGYTHGDADRREEAIADYTRVIELPEAPLAELAIALNNRGSEYGETGNSEGLLDDFGRLLSIPDQAGITDIIAPRLHHYAKEVVAAIFTHSTASEKWSARIGEFLAHFSRYGGLAELGDALVQHLPELAKSPLNHAAYDAWAEAWVTACAAMDEADQDPFEIPLRLLRAGVEYLKTEQEKHLLVLPSEERKILRQTLGLPPEKSA